ncbi:MAG: AAA family ATPase [Candidatus Dojkabacteria bacterium]
MQNKIYIFIGPPSSGKSYLGRKYAEYKGYTFYEADDDYKEEYRERTKISPEETEKVYEEFYSTVIGKIKEKLKLGKSVVVASAIGKQRNRDRFTEEFGEDVCFVYIKTSQKNLVHNALTKEFPALQGVEKLEKKVAQGLREHLSKKFLKYETPVNVIVVENDYSENVIPKMIDLLEE